MFGNTIIAKLETEIAKKPYIIGFVLVGSYTRKEVYGATEFSDLEAYVIVEDSDTSKVEKDLVEIVGKLGKVIFHYKNRWSGFSVVFENLFRLELPVVRGSDIKNVFTRPIAQPVEVLIDRTGGELKKVLAARPKELNFESVFQETFLDFWYMAVLAVQYLKKGEYWNTRHAQEVVLVPSLIKLFELLDNKDLLLLESNKRIEAFLDGKKLEILKNVSTLYEANDIRGALKMCIKEFAGVCEQIKEKYGYKYQEEVVGKIKPQLENLLK